MNTRRDVRKAEGASLSKAKLRDRYRSWVQHHRLSAADSLARVLDRPVASFLTWLVIGIALAMPVGFNLALDNVNQLSKGWNTSTQVSLFLVAEISVEEGRAFATQLSERGDLEEAQFIDRAEALAEFSSLSGFADVLGSLDSNPLPHLILVTPAEGSAVPRLKGELQKHPSVAEVVLDMEWLNRLNNFLILGQRMVLVVAGLLVVGVLLILGNTIRLAIENRREEVVIVKLVGGSNAFVRRPFLYTGLWYGVGGGAVAAMLVAAAVWVVQEPVGDLAQSYGSLFRLQGPGVIGGLQLVLLGGALGLSGAWLAVTQHLTRIEPG